MPGPFDLNLRHFLAVRTIAARGRIGLAAEAESLTQPALTQGLARLEAQLGVALFVRRPDRSVPTQAGALLVDRAERALQHLRKAVRAGDRGFASPERLMTATQLRAFLALADAGSFLGAAQQTHVSQPAIHRAVRDLEQIVGMALVERRGRGIALTERGRRLACAARLVAGEMAAAIAESGAGAGTGTRVTVGAMPLSRAQVLPLALDHFLGDADGTRVSVVEGSWRELVEQLREGAIDMMIGALRDQPGLGDIVQTPLFEDRLAVVARPGHPLAGAGQPDLTDLARYRWIVGHAGSPLRQHWERLFDGTPLPPGPIECGSVMTIRELLRRRDYLTLLSPAQVRVELEAGLLTLVGNPLARCVRVIGLSTRAAWRATPAQDALMRAIAHVTRDSGLNTSL